jgi:membrane protease YdiL (CAAX protease family)
LRGDARLDAAAVLAILVLSNVVANRLLPSWAYVPWNLLVAALLLLLARRAGLGRGELGLGRWGDGLRWGLGAAAVVLAVYLVAVALPATRDLFHDRRVAGGLGELAYHTLFRIPFGTVILEEVAFRSVLPAFAARRYGVSIGVVIASVLFGIWHVLPALGIVDVNPVAEETFSGAGGTVLAVLGAVLVTTIAGLVLCWLRYRSGSLLASIVVHISTNSMAYALAWTVS